MTVKAGMRVLNGHVVEVVGSVALVAFDDGRKSDWIHVGKLLAPQVGRPPGSGARIPKTPKALKVERRLAEVLRDEMAKQDLTWEALAARSGVSRATLARLLAENGAGSTLDTVEALASAVGVSPSAFWIKK
jgi:hypothetical protein